MTKPIIYWLSRNFLKFKLLPAFITNSLCRSLNRQSLEAGDIFAQHGRGNFVFKKLLEIEANISELEYVIMALKKDMAKYNAYDIEFAPRLNTLYKSIGSNTY